MPGIHPGRIEAPGLSSKVRKRIGNRLEEDLRLNGSVDALNAWRAGDARKVFRPGPRPLARIAEGSRLQRQTLTGLLEDLRNLREWEIKADSESDAEAFRALMRKS